MKKKIIVLIVAMVLCVALSMGCVETSTTVNVEDEDDALLSQNQQEVSVKEASKNTVIVGRLIGITFNSKGPDVLVFQDGKKKVIFCAIHAEKFEWKVGENHKVTILKMSIGGERVIKDVKIINDI